MRATTAATGATSLMNRNRLRCVERLPERVQILPLRRIAEEVLRRRLAPRVQVVGLFLAQAEVRRADRVRGDADGARRHDVLELLAVPGFGRGREHRLDQGHGPERPWDLPVRQPLLDVLAGVEAEAPGRPLRMRAVEQPDREVRQKPAVDDVVRTAGAIDGHGREQERVAHAHAHRIDDREAVLLERLAVLVAVLGQIVRHDQHPPAGDVRADHVQPVLRALVLLRGDVRDLLDRREVVAPDVTEGQLRLSERPRARRGRELLAHPLLEVAARRGAADPCDRVDEPADPDTAGPAVGEALVVRVGEDLLQPLRVVPHREQGADDRARRRAGEVDPFLYARLALCSGECARECDAFDAAALEDAVRTVLLVDRRHPASSVVLVVAVVGSGAPAFSFGAAVASVSCAKRSLKPARNATTRIAMRLFAAGSLSETGRCVIPLVKAKEIARANAAPIIGRRPPRKNAYGRPTSSSSAKSPALMRCTTLTTAPTAPAIRAATHVCHSMLRARAATSEIRPATAAMPAKYAICAWPFAACR